MRTGNGNEDRVIKRLAAGTEVEVLQSAEPWSKIKHENREGYILTAYIAFENGKMQSSETADILKKTVWMQSKPDKGAEYRIVKIPKYSSVKVLEPDSGGWTKVKYWNDEGYIQSNALTKGWGVTRE
ncbi:MAG: SH3 domain-containing protein [Burkholderiales bacterium]